MNEIDLERALNDPAGLFGNPDAVVHHPALTREQKIQILNHWRLDASRLEGSEAEGMGAKTRRCCTASTWRSRPSWASSEDRLMKGC